MAFALSRLKQDLLQGTEWQGELADALTFVQEDYWEANPDQLKEYRAYLTEAYNATGDEDLNWDAKDTRERRRVRLY